MKIHVFLFTPPAWRTYRNNLNEEQLEILYKTMKNITKKYKNITYHSFLDDKRFIKKISMMQII